MFNFNWLDIYSICNNRAKNVKRQHFFYAADFTTNNYEKTNHSARVCRKEGGETTAHPTAKQNNYDNTTLISMVTLASFTRSFSLKRTL